MSLFFTIRNTVLGKKTKMTGCRFLDKELKITEYSENNNVIKIKKKYFKKIQKMC